MRTEPILLRALLVLVVTALFLPSPAAANPIGYADLWDISRGTVVTGSSGALSGGWSSDARNMFGGTFGSGPPDVLNNTIFRDYQPAGTVHCPPRCCCLAPASWV